MLEQVWVKQNETVDVVVYVFDYHGFRRKSEDKKSWIIYIKQTLWRKDIAEDVSQ